MMEITFKGNNKTYRLSCTDRQYVLSERIVIQTGENKGKYAYSPVGVYSRIETVFDRVLHIEIADSDAHAFAELFAIIRDTKDYLITLVSEKTESAKDGALNE